ncbi:hypothetical protein BV22DRAFT_1023250 [Leucogyrophana mollusca]|uniref:Uncharacterized protein n=1 Tax=Leucogyrophana mollusca TaxID=85980 RepID=A0ACB8B2G5_9AGAM|nr:hypothetical protein BV22DRAFT_1023250 [Leucogyrophana mollusca]
MSLSVADTDKPTFSPYIPPPVQRLSLPPSVALSNTTFPLPSSSRLPSSQENNSTVTVTNKTRAASKPASTSASGSAGPSTSNSTIFPYLHRLEIGDDMSPRRQKRPLLVLKLTSLSFLDAVAMDAGSEKPLYAVETVGSSTTIWRSDPWDGFTKTADIRWPKELPFKGKGRENAHGALVQMNGCGWKNAESFLKVGSLGSSRKFSVPHHPHSLKWKRSGSLYQCMSAPFKCPIATLEPSEDETPPQLKIYESLETRHSVPQLDHAGISLSLLDHIFVTALLLVSEPEEWMTIAHHPIPSENPSTDALPIPRTNSIKTPASARQWRKIMYGEPLYPSLKTPCFDTGVPLAHGDDADVLDISEPAQLPTSIQQWRKIVYGEPLYPSLRPHSAGGIDLPPRPNTAWDTASISSESAYYPPTPSSAPSTGFFDSSFFEDSERTVPRINTNERYSSPLTLSPSAVSPIPSSECVPLSAHPSPSPRTNGRRELPAPPSSYNPPPSTQPWLHRSRSSPTVSPAAAEHIHRVTEDGILIPPAVFDDNIEPESAGTNASRNRALSSGSIMRRRQLPTVPSAPASPVNTVQQRQHSGGGDRRLSGQYQRTLPPTPVSISRSESAGGHRHAHSHSHGVPAPPMTNTTPARPATAHSPSGVPTTRRPRHEKDPEELLGWMRSVTRAHHRRTLNETSTEGPVAPEEGVYEPPPPAYNAIDFSTPPQARSPPSGRQS